MIERHKKWYEHEKWANAATLDSIGLIPGSVGDERYQHAIDKMDHLLKARQLWLHRLGAGEKPGEVFPTGSSLAEVRTLSAEVGSAWDAYFATLDDAQIRNRVDYTSWEGKEHSNTLGEILVQLYTHGFYHRGQVASLVNALGGEPAVTDFIFWSRTG